MRDMADGARRGNLPAATMTDYREEITDERPPEAPRLRYNPTRTRDEGAFRKAQNHSRLVRRLRIILPAIALVAIGALWATARVIPGDLASLVAMSGIDVKSNSVIMQHPHISGFEGTRRAYEVRADSATQNLDDPKVVTFHQIVGRFGLDQAGEATVNAATGIYNGNNNTLLLRDGVNLNTTNGYAGALADAKIDLGQGTMTSDKPIEFSSSDGSIRANAVTVTERGKHVLFTNGVSVKFLPPDNVFSGQPPDPQAIQQ
jgi:lipopolysaccharide export system protein LptC